MNGAGRDLSRKNVDFYDCLFRDNYAPLNAGAVGVSINSQCNFNNCRFENNSSLYMAGAIANFDNSRMDIIGCVFAHNSGGETGAIRVYGSPAIISNCTFFGNASGLGTIYCNTSANVLITNNIVMGDQSGFGLYASNTPLMGCNIFYDNADGSIFAVSLHFTDRTVDPLFCNAEIGDFSLCSDSPARDNNSDCGLVGAVSNACGTCGSVATETTTWDGLKSMFR